MRSCLYLNIRHFVQVQLHGVDAFMFCWAGQNNWLCPPIALILRVLEKVKTDRATVGKFIFLGYFASNWRVMA